MEPQNRRRQDLWTNVGTKSPPPTNCIEPSHQWETNVYCVTFEIFNYSCYSSEPFWTNRVAYYYSLSHAVLKKRELDLKMWGIDRGKQFRTKNLLQIIHSLIMHESKGHSFIWNVFYLISFVFLFLILLQITEVNLNKAKWVYST